MKRREFVKTSAFAVAGLMSMSTMTLAGKAKKNVGLQIYTLRDSIFKDPKGVLKKVAEFGYKELETFAYNDGKIFGMPFGEFADYVNGLGMEVCSGHYGLDLAKGDKWEQAVTDAKSIGQKYMVVPYIQDTERKSIDDYKKICASLNKAGEVCTRNGIRFGYHNHAFEFDTLDGQIPFDVMLAELDPKHVGMEMDIYWVVRAGKDPIQYFEKYPGRFEQWHVKDMDKNNKDRNADVGTGAIDFKPIFAKAKLSGMKHYYVEQESYPGDPIDSVAASIKNLKAIL
ncbi:MAG TPA: sugar phosphate isomerase/epimerase [Chryseosolibacter sp.]|nr:sugar phosphate isomerase/epimerase [Chryseosolibacter sp.]